MKMSEKIIDFADDFRRKHRDATEGLIIIFGIFFGFWIVIIGLAFMAAAWQLGSLLGLIGTSFLFVVVMCVYVFIVNYIYEAVRW